ncbi:MAG: transposase, partial [Candidatus Aenigmatarchaeota archaeon]
MSKKMSYPIDKVIQILAEASLPGNTIASVCRKYNISDQTFYKWKSKYGGLNSSEAKRLKVLEEENNRLKKILAEKELEIQ